MILGSTTAEEMMVGMSERLIQDMSKYGESYKEDEAVKEMFDDFTKCNKIFATKEIFQPHEDGTGLLQTLYQCNCLQEFLRNLSALYRYLGSHLAYRQGSTYATANTKCWAKIKPIRGCRLYGATGIDRTDRCIQYYVEKKATPEWQAIDAPVFNQIELQEPYEHHVTTQIIKIIIEINLLSRIKKATFFYF